MRLAKFGLTGKGVGKNPNNRIALFLSAMPPWVLFGLVVVMCVLTAEAGSFAAQYRQRTGIPESDAPIATAVAAILGLLAFMLGFIFSITAERYSGRKDLVVQHANAIRTCYLRTGLLPEKQRFETRTLLRQYIAIQLEFHAVAGIEKTIEKINDIHSSMWRQATLLVKEEMDSEIRSLFISSVNACIELFNARKTVSMIFRIPNIVWISLLLLTAMSMFAYGYQNGVSGSGHIIQMPLLAASFGMIVILISEMDAIGWQHFQIGYEPFLDLQKMANEDNDT